MNREIEARLKLSAIDRTGKAFGAVSKRFGQVDKQAAAYNKRQRAVAQTTRAMNAEMLAFAGRVAGPAAVAFGFKKSIDAATSFEESMFGIEKKLGGSADEMERIAADIKSLASEVPASIDQIAQAFERGAAAGIPTAELKEFARLSTVVADSWDMDAGQVSDIFAGFKAGLKITSDEIEPLADVINYLADTGISDESDIANFIDRVGASLTNIGFTPQQIAAYGAALVELKMPAEVAARAMDTLAGKLAAPENLSDKSFNALEKIVGDVKEFRKVMGEDGSAGMLKFLEGLEKLTGQERMSLLGALMGEGFDDEVARMVGGVDQIRSALERAQDENAYKGSIAGLSEKRLELFSSKMQFLKNDIHSIGIAIGDSIIDPLGKVVAATSNMLGEHDAYKAGIEKATSLGESKSSIKNRFLDWYREQNPDVGRWDRQAEWEKAVQAYGRGDTDSVFSGLIRRRDELEFMDRERAARGDGSYLPSASAGSTLPHPGQRPVPMSLTDQYASYGKGSRESAQAGGNKYQYKDPRNWQMEDAQNYKYLQDLQAAADAAKTNLGEGGRAAADEISSGAPESGAQFGNAANEKINSGAAAAGAAFGDAAAAKIAQAAKQLEGAAGRAARRESNRIASGNPGRTMADAGVTE